MFAKINTAGLFGVEGYPVVIEADVRNGLPGMTLTGLLSTETREAQARVMNALGNSGLHPEPKKITVNFSPAGMRKEGTAYDLPIAVAVLCAYGMLKEQNCAGTAFFGELGLDGSLKGVRGALPLAFALKEAGFTRVVTAAENAAEAALVEDMQVFGCRDIREVMELLRRAGNGWVPAPVPEAELPSGPSEGSSRPDFSDVRGQKYLKRAAEIAASGMHNLLMSGPAGTGKTMIAKRLPSILPEMTREENLEISKIYSICGLLPKGHPLLDARPFRSPHHSITEPAFAGGGVTVLPGEMSLASGGILFLDELPLFKRAVLEQLRQPLEDHKITITRMYGSCVYPADFLLVAACNNCRCGFYPDLKKCRCTRGQIQAYIGRISKPLMERIDLCAEANPLRVDEIVGKRKADEEEASAVIRKRVEAVHALQKERYKGETFRFNSRLGIREIEKYCVLGRSETAYLKDAFTRKGLSGRTYHKILKVARTIADMEGSERIREEHLAEAVEFRSIDDRLFGGGIYNE
ncbi:MAG: YifB family Mg chelatase-like AAA ATPase [Lachnospiraceae bacterium]|nr:YifB family Mg chelatase-like AAA ATPase [Lachnospiraceae bacterium]